MADTCSRKMGVHIRELLIRAEWKTSRVPGRLGLENIKKNLFFKKERKKESQAIITDMLEKSKLLLGD